MRTVFSICGDAEGTDYDELLKCLLVNSSRFHLVWVDSACHESSAISLRGELTRWEIDRRRRSAWPGIRYTAPKPIATIIFYETDLRQVEILKQSGSLFGWLPPKWPEDIGFYGQDGKCNFATVSHEREGWLFDANIASLTAEVIGWTEETWEEKEFALFDSPVQL